MSFQDEIAEGLSELVAEAGVPIEIRRGEKRITGKKGVPTSGRRLAVAAEVVRVAGKQDWLIMAVDYDFGNGPTTPKRNDQVIDSRDGAIYEALPEDNEDIYSGAVKSQHRLHTTRIK